MEGSRKALSIDWGRPTGYKPIPKRTNVGVRHNTSHMINTEILRDANQMDSDAVKVNQTMMWKILVMYFDAQHNIPDKIDDNPEDDSKDRSSNPMEGIAEDSEYFSMEGIESQEGKNVIAFKD
ncbi:hypothetical protein L208DRAFT_1383258 [Tricholoma matsutake]|nr:hypothetical protein L208DRAFT_1383258 [Tricholoma matsutake 945]